MADIGLTGGGKIDAALAKIAQRAKSGALVRVGFLEGATYQDGTSVATVAAIQEFGAPAKGIPPRPFFRNMIAKESPHWGKDLGEALKLYDYDAEKALKAVGEGIASALRQSIHDTNTPPLKPETIKRKGFATPLIDTGHMFNSVSYEVTANGSTTEYNWNQPTGGFVAKTG